MKDLYSANQILGMGIIRDKRRETIFKLSKKQASKTKASRQRMAKIPYALIVGSVMYAIVCTMLDIAHAVGVVSRFMSNPGREHWEAVKWLVRYLKVTSKDTLCFSRKVVVLEGFFEIRQSASDADHGDSDDGSSSSFKDLNFRGFIEEETKALSLMITKKVGKAVKKAMPYYINQTTANIKEMIQKELEEFKMEGVVKESKKENAM
nr:hypothetical protein [Tanacetum cinerariifolium]